jgi:centrosomal protein CEP164
MNIEEDKDLMWIAREGLKTPLPDGWKACQTKNEEIFYFNFITGESKWEHPLDSHYKNLYSNEKNRKSIGG